MKHSERPTEMLIRQLEANRSAARFRNKLNPKQRHFCHLDTFRKAFIDDIIAIRKELKKKRRSLKMETD